MTTVLPTIDGDPGSTFPQRKNLKRQAPALADIEAYRAAVNKLFLIFDSCNLKGKLTWFVNEPDVNWTGYYPDLLREIISRKDTLALHVHYDGLFGAPKLSTFETAVAVCAEAKAKLELLSGRPCVCHRSGCFFQSEHIYRCVERLGFKVVSDVYLGYKGAGAGGEWVDNSMVPFDVKPWRHSASNWLNYNSTEGTLFHIPVAAQGMRSLADLHTRVKKMEVVCWDIHPHELQNADGSLSNDRVGILMKNLARIDKELSPAYMNFDEFMRGSTWRQVKTQANRKEHYAIDKNP